MKGSVRLFRETWKPVLGATALGLFLVGCGDKESNPEAVTVDELKYPGNLVIKDQGNGAAVLWWSGANNEEKFDGYNVYGMIGKAADLGVTDGTALELLDDKGEASEAAKTVLGNFNYGVDTKLTAKAEAKNDDGEVEFSALPIHTGAADARLLPTCKPQAGVCGMTTAENKDKTAEDPTYAVNGAVKFTVPDPMVVGNSYCFLVLSSMDGGQTVSQTSSNVECFVPKYKAAFNITNPAAGASAKFDLAAYLTACAASGTCPADPATGTATLAATTDADKAQSAGPLYIRTSNSGLVTFVAGKNSAIIDLGFYANGFDDATLPAAAPKLVLDTDVFGTGDAESPIFNEGGYSLAGQSLPVEKNHMYVIAVGDSAATAAVTTFNYHWVYVSGDVTAGTATAVEMRLSKTAE